MLLKILLLAGAVLASGCTGGAQERKWVRIKHPTLPISFEVPKGREGPVGHLVAEFGYISDGDGDYLRSPYWGNRNSGSFTVVKWGFWWLTPMVHGVSTDDLRRLSSGRLEDSRSFIERFGRGGGNPVRPVANDRVDGRVASILEIGPLAEPPHSQESYFLAVVPFGERGVLVISSTPYRAREGESWAVFTRVLSSVRFARGQSPLYD